MPEGSEGGENGNNIRNSKNKSNLSKIDPIESRWIFQDEDNSNSDEGESSGFSHRTSSESEEEEDNAEQRLIRTRLRIDSFDVEALEVPEAYHIDYESLRNCRRQRNLYTWIVILMKPSIAWECTCCTLPNYFVENKAMYWKVLAKYVDDPKNFFSMSLNFCHWGARICITLRKGNNL